MLLIKLTQYTEYILVFCALRIGSIESFVDNLLDDFNRKLEKPFESDILSGGKLSK